MRIERLPAGSSPFRRIAGQRLWRSRAAREASAVRRALTLARAGKDAVVGSPSTVSALLLDRVAELYVTRRFVEHATTANIIELATTHNVKIRIPSGAAEFELDLIGNGVAALLRPQPAHIN